jgi:hypothetical protein
MTSGVTLRPSEVNSSTASSVEVNGSLSMTVLIAPIPIATAGTRIRPGRCDAAVPRAADEQSRKDGATTESREREGVGDTFGHEQHDQGTDRPGAGMDDQPGQCALAGVKDSFAALVGDLGERDGDDGDHQSGQRGVEETLLHHQGLEGQPGQSDGCTDERRHQPDGQGPSEHGHGGVAEVWETRNGQRERAEPGEVVQPDEDEGAYACGQ